jgi:hypothetical protein
LDNRALDQQIVGDVLEPIPDEALEFSDRNWSPWTTAKSGA